MAIFVEMVAKNACGYACELDILYKSWNLSDFKKEADGYPINQLIPKKGPSPSHHANSLP